MGVFIGNNVLLGSKVLILSTSHGKYAGDNQTCPYIPSNEREILLSPVSIGNNVWIGNNASILSGISIGKGCIVGANSVVTKSVPENCMVCGSPARIINKFNIKTMRWEAFSSTEGGVELP